MGTVISDLAVGNSNEPNRVYANKGGYLIRAWSSDETDDTTSINWGDWDSDGDLDLAVGNKDEPNRVYANETGKLRPVWRSPEWDERIVLTGETGTVTVISISQLVVGRWE